MRVEKISDILQKLPLFDGVKQPIIEAAARYMKFVYVDRHTTLAKAGEVVNKFFIVVTGRLYMQQLHKEIGRNLVVGIADRGQVVGNTGALSVSAPWTTDVVSSELSRILVVRYNALRVIIEMDPKIA